MNLVFSDQAFPTSTLKSLFLAGPSPRSRDQLDWRQEALRLLAELGYDGTVLIPIPENIFYGRGTGDIDYDHQIAWEHKARLIADNIVFWVPRVIDTARADLGMPAFTTNFELGEDLDSGKLTYGRPDDAVKCKYLDLRVKATGYPIHRSLASLLEATVLALGAGACRVDGEVNVPLFIWSSPLFQGWYTSLKAAGNVLHDAQVLHQVKIGGQHLFSYVLSVKVWVTAEQRFKSNEFVIARPDISVVVAYHRDGNSGAVKLALVKEFRSTVNNAEGYVYELPGGSSFKADETPALLAQNELHEELGLVLPNASRLEFVAQRQVAATLSSHRASVYALRLTDAELANLEIASRANRAYGMEADSERTFVHLVDVNDLFKTPVDCSNLGIIFEALAFRRENI